MLIDFEDKKTDKLLKEVAELQKFEAIEDKLTEIIDSGEGELDLNTMDMVRAAGYKAVPNYSKFLEKLNKNQ